MNRNTCTRTSYDSFTQHGVALFHLVVSSPLTNSKSYWTPIIFILLNHIYLYTRLSHAQSVVHLILKRIILHDCRRLSASWAVSSVVSAPFTCAACGHSHSVVSNLG